jgi:hypothetical protein
VGPGAAVIYNELAKIVQDCGPCHHSASLPSQSENPLLSDSWPVSLDDFRDSRKGADRGTYGDFVLRLPSHGLQFVTLAVNKGTICNAFRSCLAQSLWMLLCCTTPATFQT